MAARPAAARTSSVTSYVSNASDISLGSDDSWELEQRRLAQAEWEEGLRQLHLACQVMVLPL
jgi:hypothetical protein